MRHVVASALALGALSLGHWGCTQSADWAPPLPSQSLPDLSKAGLQRSWQRSVPLSSNEHVRNAWRIGGSVYVTTDSARIIRINAADGALTFDKGLGAENLQIYRPIDLKPAVEGGFGEVLVATRVGAYVFNQETGDLARPDASLGISPSCAPVVVGNTVCVGGAGRLYGFYLDRLSHQRWSKDARGDLFNSTPAVVGNDIIIASKSGELARLNSEDGDWRWKDRKTNGQVLGGLAVDGVAVYVPSMDQRLYAFSAERGAELWQAQLQGTLDQTPALGGSVVLCPAGGVGLFALDRQNGNRKWLAEGVTSVATVIGNHVWVGDDQGNLKSLALETGDVLATIPIPDAAYFIRNEEDETIYVINRSGTVGAYTARR
jgi:outer membrane protein assembly factor BamB